MARARGPMRDLLGTGLRSWAGALGMALALVALGCRAKDGAAGERAEISIGGTLPLTGAESKVGGFFKEGYELAFEELERAGGLEVGGKKLPVKLRLLDD